MAGDTAANTDDSLGDNWGYGVWQGIHSGFYDDVLLGQDYLGAYWSSTAYSTDFAFSLAFSGGVYPDIDHFKFSGLCYLEAQTFASHLYKC